MARLKIVRAQDGSAAKKFKQGEKNTNVEVDVTTSVDISGHEQNVWETGAGHKALHQTSKARNIPAAAKGYIHSHSNTLFAVSRLDTKKHTIEIIAEGSVNAGVHTF
jgi:hypothetical protein